MAWISVQQSPSPKHVYRAPGRGIRGRSFVFFFLFPAMRQRVLPLPSEKGVAPRFLGYDL